MRKRVYWVSVVNDKGTVYTVGVTVLPVEGKCYRVRGEKVQVLRVDGYGEVSE